MSYRVCDFVFTDEDEAQAFSDNLMETQGMRWKVKPTEAPAAHRLLDDEELVRKQGTRLVVIAEEACLRCGGRGWTEVEREVEVCGCGTCGDWREAAGRFVIGLQKGDRRAVRLAGHWIQTHTVDS